LFSGDLPERCLINRIHGIASVADLGIAREHRIMSQRTVLPEKAARYFRNGFNCAQSVLLTMFEHSGGKDELVPKIATAFGAGIGRCGSVCGALTGGVMAVGIRYGTNEPSAEKRSRAYDVGRRLYDEFRRRNGAVACRELIGYDLTDAMERKKANQSKVFEKKCPTFVRSTVEILLELAERDV
jgi:C_GCAxxG_C_C family probable redox protein